VTELTCLQNSASALYFQFCFRRQKLTPHTFQQQGLWCEYRYFIYMYCVPTQSCKLKNKNQLDATYYFIVLLTGSTLTLPLPSLQKEMANVVINIIVVSS